MGLRSTVTAWSVTRRRNLGLVTMFGLTRPVPRGWNIFTTAVVARRWCLFGRVLSRGWDRGVSRGLLGVARRGRFVTRMARRVLMLTTTRWL